MSDTEFENRTDPVRGSTDHSLVVGVRRGEQDAATRLYLKYAQRLQSLAAAQTSAELRQRVDPEEVVQSVFRTFFRRVSGGLYDVPPGEELWQLLLVLALNKIRKLATHHHAQKRDVRRTLGSRPLEAGREPTAEHDEQALSTLRLLIDELLEGLPTAHRQIVELRISGWQTDEISRQVDRSTRTIERVLQEFRQKLSRLIET